MAHRRINFNDEDEQRIAAIQEYFRNDVVPIEVHWNEVIRTALRELEARLSDTGQEKAPAESDGGDDS